MYLFVRRDCSNYTGKLLLSATYKILSNYTGKLLLSATYKILSNILPSWLTPYAKEIIGDHQWGF